MGVAWMDGRVQQAQVASGTSKAGQTKGWADGQANGPNRAKIARRIWDIYICVCVYRSAAALTEGEIQRRVRR